MQPEDDYVSRTRAWLEGVVLRYNLCPFAHAPYKLGRIRFVVAMETRRKGILEALRRELLFLQGPEGEATDTTLLILPNAAPDFYEFNDFMDGVDDLVARLKLEGVFQVVSFHPDFLFADSAPDDFANHTNRSPYPMLHLLREEQVERAVESHPDVDSIPETNIRCLRGLSDAEKEAVTSLATPPEDLAGS